MSALRYVYGHDDVVADFVASLLPHASRGWSKSRAIGVINRDGNLIAGLVYHNYNPDADIIEMSAAAIDHKWLTRETIKRMYHYPFIELGCQMVMHVTTLDNERVLRI